MKIIIRTGMAAMAGFILAVAGISSDAQTSGTFTDANWSSLGAGVDGGENIQFIDGEWDFFAYWVSCVTCDPSGDLYAGGYFTNAGGVTANNIARWNGANWSALGAGVDGTASALACDSAGNLYAGGDFTKAGDGASVNYVAKWNGANWSALGGGVDGDVSALACDTAGNLYAAGAFTSAGGVTANYVAKWNGANWSPLGSGLNNSVSALVWDGSGNLYAGGNFTTAGGISANFVARWNGAAWFALGAGMNGDVNALACDGAGNLYASGSFTNAGGVLTNGVAEWNGAGWSGLGSGLESVSALACDISGNLYAGGTFTNAGGVAANNIAQWNGTSWSALGSGVNGSLYALTCVNSNNLYIGGFFTQAGTNAANYVAEARLVECSISIQPLSQSVLDGSDVSLEVGVAGIGPLYYQWSFDGTNLADATNSILVLTNVSMSNNGAYRVTVSNSFGSAVSGNAVLQVESILATTLPPTVLTTTSAVLQGEVNGGTNAATAWFQWGASASYGNVTATTIIQGNGSNVPISATLSGLNSANVYHYRIAAENAEGAVFGADQTFPSVLNTGDGGPGSLREAIATALPGSVITFHATGTIALTNGELLITKNLTLIGPGADTLAISGSLSNRIFAIDSNATVVLSGLTIRDGLANDGAEGLDASGIAGGGIYNAGTLLLSNCVLADNIAGSGLEANASQGATIFGGPGGNGGDGGGIYNSGFLAAVGCAFQSNYAGGGGLGGVGFDTGGFDDWNQVGYGGSGGYGGDGGGIFNLGAMSLTNCILAGNSGGAGGTGGEGEGGGGGNGGDGGAGGGIFNSGTATLWDCIVETNQGGGGGLGGAGVDIYTLQNAYNGACGAGGNGGGIYNAAPAASAEVDDTLVELNGAGRSCGSSGGPSDIAGDVMLLGSPPLNLSSFYNRAGIWLDGSSFSTGGLNGSGYAYSADLLGWAQIWSNSLFAFGPPNATNVISAKGQTIPLPMGNYARLQMLATAVLANQPAQVFTVTYADGSQTNFVQSLSNWSTPQNYPGESLAVAMPYRNVSAGVEAQGTFYLYGYSFGLDVNKVAQSIQLPTNSDVIVLAISLETNSPPAFNLSSLMGPSAVAGQNYSADISTNLSDPDGLVPVLTKVSGPAWLNVGPGGALSGVPYSAQAGVNTFVLSVTDSGGLSNTAALNITVLPAPPIVAGLGGTGNNMVLTWQGGIAPFHVQMSTNLANGEWMNIGSSIPSNTLSVPPAGRMGFFRIVGQ